MSDYLNTLYSEYENMDSRQYTVSDKFLGGGHLSGDTLLTIATVAIEEMRDGKEKMCIQWQEPKFLPWLLNKTNIKRLQKMFGDDTETWLGKTVTLYFDPDVEYMGETVGGLRVRVEKKS